MGVIFNRDEQGGLGARAFGGQRKARTFFVGDITGQAILHVMFEQLLRWGFRTYDEWFVTSLVVQEGICCGVVALEMRTGGLHTIRAKSVVLCTGGAGRAFDPSTNATTVTANNLATTGTASNNFGAAGIVNLSSYLRESTTKYNYCWNATGLVTEQFSLATGCP